jgi:hypothetical protein
MAVAPERFKTILATISLNSWSNLTSAERYVAENKEPRESSTSTLGALIDAYQLESLDAQRSRAPGDSNFKKDIMVAVYQSRIYQHLQFGS